MDTNTQQVAMPRPEVEARPLIAAGSLGEGVAGGAAIVLSLIGLAGQLTYFMVSIATICIGVAFLFEGAAIANRIRAFLEESSSRQYTILSEVGTGLSAEFIAGLGGITLGILALVGVTPAILVPAAAILFGGALILGTANNSRFNHLLILRHEEDEIAREVAQQSVSAAGGMQTLIGVGSVVLGILSLVFMGGVWLTLSFAALLSLGVADVLGGIGITPNWFKSSRYQPYQP
jgi:hypothetical protein